MPDPVKPIVAAWGLCPGMYTKTSDFRTVQLPAYFNIPSQIPVAQWAFMVELWCL